MGESDDTLREQLMRSLLESASAVPTSSARRLGRTALAMLKTGRLIRKDRRSKRNAKDLPVDEQKLAAIITSIGGLKGVAMKMGQIMSYIDIALPEELRQALSVLQTHAQPMGFERVRDIVQSELNDRAPELLAQMQPRPVAAASIGQVHRARLPDGTPVAVKIQYPEIEKAIRSDFRPAAMGTRIASLFYPGARVDEFVQEARSRFLEECDYRHEAAAQARFAELFADHPVISVPAVHPRYGSRLVLTTTFVEGVHFEDYLATNPSQAERDHIGRTLFGFYLGTLFTQRLYNCDPHPGNYLFLPDRRLAILDYGCTREFEPEFVEKLAALTRAAHADRREDLHQALLAIGMVRPGRKYDFDTARALVRSFYGPMIEDRECRIDLGQAIDMRSAFQTKRKLLKLSLPGEFLFLLRIRFGLLSVLARLGARANWHRLECGYLENRPNDNHWQMIR